MMLPPKLGGHNKILKIWCVSNMDPGRNVNKPKVNLKSNTQSKIKNAWNEDNLMEQTCRAKKIFVAY